MRRYDATDDDVLYLLNQDAYTVCLETATVTSPRGRIIVPRTEGNGSEEYLFVRLYFSRAERKIALHKLVWMAGTRSLVPENFEVHHRDNDTRNNSFINLMAIHKIDHKKIHADDPAEIPF